MALQRRDSPVISSSRILYTICGAVFGIALVLSCSDDSLSSVDAAACECPASEPPLATRITSTSVQLEIAAMAADGQFALCPTGARVLSGGCRRVGATTVDVTLVEAGPATEPVSETGSWSCRWKNNTTEPVIMNVTALCLAPAP